MRWDDVSDFYRKRPARFKAIQYINGMELPPFQQQYAWETSEIILNEGDWIVLDLESSKTHILPDTIFSLIFEKV